MSGRWRIGLRPEKSASGACLTMPPRLGLVVHLARIRVSSDVFPAIVANLCLGGWGRLRRIFRPCPRRHAGAGKQRAGRTAPAARHAPGVWRAFDTSRGVRAPVSRSVGTRATSSGAAATCAEARSAKAGQFVNRSAGASIGGGAVSPLTPEQPRSPTDCWLSPGFPQPTPHRKVLAEGSIYRARRSGSRVPAGRLTGGATP